MSNLNNLAPGEQVLHRARRSIFIFVDTIAFTTLCLIFAVCVYALNWFTGVDNATRIVIAFCPLLIALVLFCYDVISYFFLELVVTNRRFISMKGLASVTDLDVQLNRVTNIKVEKAILGAMFNFGTITILTPTGEFKYKRIDKPAQIRDIINSQIQT